MLELSFIFISFAYILRVSSLTEDTYDANFYNSIRVKFPEDPCDTTKIEVPDFSAPGRRISEAKCLEYVWRVRYGQGRILNELECDRIKLNLVYLLGGRNAEFGEYPHMCAIGWEGMFGSWVFKCGGSLISEKFVLTAAHCSKVPKSDKSVGQQKPKIVRLGGHSIMNYDIDQRKKAYDIGIKNFINHWRYRSPRQYYDIALVELESEVPFEWRVHPSCLWTRFENPDLGILSGWGVVDLKTRKTSPILQKAQVKIIDYQLCDQLLKIKTNRRWEGFMRHQLCAGDLTGRIDTCQGDSGGPLQTLIPLKYVPPNLQWNMYHIVGLTSFGFGCAQANTPGVYTRVASFVGWIESIVWPQNTTVPILKNDNRFYFKT